MTRDELLASLLLERYTNPWWTTAPPSAAATEAEKVTPLGWDDSEFSTARRRRAMFDDAPRPIDQEATA